MGTTIDASTHKSPAGTDKIPVGDGSGLPKHVLLSDIVGTGSLDSLSDAITDYDGDHNFFLGQYAGSSIDGGVENTGVGILALEDLTTGSDNTAVGRYAATSLETGSCNTALGQQALSQSLDGDDNTSVGYFALKQSSGDDNTAIGSNAGTTITTGTQNTLVGSGTAASAITAINQIVLGYGATGIGNNKAVIGNASVTDVQLGDGTAKIHADGTKLSGMVASVNAAAVLDAANYITLTTNEGTFKLALIV